ncbi:MAG: HD domain-containing protein [Treponema sp.]|nr:HD domain-containing protein [Treponema sp.]
MTDRIQKTIDFLNKTFDVSEFWKSHPSSRQYRYDHSMRVAKIGKTIAENENFDVEAVVIACLLHDCSYGLDFDISKSWNYSEPAPEVAAYDKLGLISIHGYISALHAKKFVEEELGYSGKQLEDICNAIALHTAIPENAKVSAVDNLFVKTIRDADEIDHECPFRLYEEINKFDFCNQTQKARQEFIWNTKGYQEHRINGMYQDLRTETARRLYKKNYEDCKLILNQLQQLVDDSKEIEL